MISTRLWIAVASMLRLQPLRQRTPARVAGLHRARATSGEVGLTCCADAAMLPRGMTLMMTSHLDTSSSRRSLASCTGLHLKTCWAPPPWSVSYEATDLLMRRFYAHWLGDADAPSKAEALDERNGTCGARGGFEHPGYWPRSSSSALSAPVRKYNNV